MNRKYFIASVAMMVAVAASLMASPRCEDITDQIPEIVFNDGYQKINDVAQYGHADWSNVIGIAKSITVHEAKKIADNNPEVTYFFYTKGFQMVLGDGNEGYRVFHYGDTVFFSGDPWWGEAMDLADGYIKQ